MFEQCRVEFNSMQNRLSQVVTEKWPETLRDGEGMWRWLDEAQPELREKYRSMTKRLNELWQNGIIGEFKAAVVEWGRVQLEIFKGYAQYLRQEASK